MLGGNNLVTEKEILLHQTQSLVCTAIAVFLCHVIAYKRYQYGAIPAVVLP